MENTVEFNKSLHITLRNCNFIHSISSTAQIKTITLETVWYIVRSYVFMFLHNQLHVSGCNLCSFWDNTLPQSLQHQDCL